MSLLKFLKDLFKSKKNKVTPEILSDKTIFLWEGNNTQYFHWWPMKECANSIENNLYAEGGALDKYDQLFCSKAVEYQKKYYYREPDSTQSDANWAGFCDSATILSCTRQYPSRSVNVHYNNKTATFSPKDIEALMIIASRNSVTRYNTQFYGKRYNGNHTENTSEPYPTDFLRMLKRICENKIPFALDIDKGKSVWNYSYNRVLVRTTHIPPEDFIDKIKLLPNVNRTYYNFIIESNAYPSKNLDIWGWSSKKLGVVTSDWLSDSHPDFVWKQYPKKGIWEGICKINPEINAKDVYKIYQQSIIPDGGNYLKL